MPTPESLTSLRAILETLLRASRDMHDILIMEGQAIAQRDIQTLVGCASSKQAQLLELESLEAQRRNSLDELGWTDEVDYPDRQLAELWQHVLDRLQSCQDANEVNGAMLKSQQAHVQTALDLIAGKDAQSGVYRPDGTSSRTATRMPITKA